MPQHKSTQNLFYSYDVGHTHIVSYNTEVFCEYLCSSSLSLRVWGRVSRSRSPLTVRSRTHLPVDMCTVRATPHLLRLRKALTILPWVSEPHATLRCLWRRRNDAQGRPCTRPRPPPSPSLQNAELKSAVAVAVAL